MDIYVSNLSLSATEQQLRELFSAFGTMHCSSIRTVSNADKSIRNTYAYISMEDRTAGETSIAMLHQTEFQGSIIDVKEAC